MIRATTKSVDHTKAFAGALAELARAGDVMLLSGELGAGKTAFAQGFGAALGVTEPITSPTFTLVSQYVGRLQLNHLDVYRLEQLSELADLGLAEMLDDGGVTLVEWGDAIIPALPADYLEVRFSFGEADDDRNIELRAVGPRWTARLRAMTTALQNWMEDEPPC